MKAGRNEAGQSLLEFALLLPVLIILLMGLLDLGRLYYGFVAVTDAAGEGANFGAMYPSDRSAIEDRARDATGGLIPPASVAIGILPDPIVPDPGELITVTVIYTHTLVTPLMRVLVPTGILPLRAEVTELIVENVE